MTADAFPLNGRHLQKVKTLNAVTREQLYPMNAETVVANDCGVTLPKCTK